MRPETRSRHTPAEYRRYFGQWPGRGGERQKQLAHRGGRRRYFPGEFVLERA